MRYISLFVYLLGFQFAQYTEAREPRISLDFGGYYSQGSYGLETAFVDRERTLSALPVSFKVRHWPWSFKVAVSWLRLEDEVSQPDQGKSRETISGMGDTTVTVSRDWLLKTPAPIFYSAWLKTKIPTADEKKGLGSGELDFEPGVTLMHIGTWNPFLKLSYRVKGDSPRTNYFNQWKTGLGVSYKHSNRLRISTLINSKQRSTEAAGTNTYFLMTSQHYLTPEWSVTPYAIYGLSEYSDDYALGFNVTRKF